MAATWGNDSNKREKMIKKRQQESSPMHYKFFILKWASTLLWISLLLLATSATAMRDGDNYSSVNYRKISPIRTISSSVSNTTYAVVFDAGSSGSRVHVYHFNHNLDLLLIGEKIEVFAKTKPGLSSYADDPQKAAASLIPLLDKAETTVPSEFHTMTPLILGATAGLRLLDGDKAERILEAVRKLFKSNSSFRYDADEVTVLRGTQEGSYLWVTINYLLENLGRKYGKTVGVVDLGGGSVQMAYAISRDEAAKAPKLPENEDSYVQHFFLKGTNYYLYVHSYLNYGLLAARAEILKVTRNSTNPCILAGYQGSYEYNGNIYKASASPSGSTLSGCGRVILEALKANKPCNYSACTFDGIWNGGGGDGQNNLYLASLFYDKAVQTNIIEPNKSEAKIRPIDYKKAAERACRTKYVDAKAAFPNFYKEDLAFVCMDLVYEYTLLIDGFGLNPRKEIMLVQQLKYNGSQLVEVAWPLGNALTTVSSLRYSNAVRYSSQTI